MLQKYDRTTSIIEAKPAKHLTALLLGLIVIGCAALFAFLSFTQPISGHEHLGHMRACPSWQAAFDRYLQPINHFESNGFLYYLLSYLLWGESFSTDYVHLARILPSVSAWGTIIIGYWLGKALADRATGLYTAFILGVNSYLWSIASYHHYYATNCLLVALSTLLLLYACRRGSVKLWCAYGASLIACTATMVLSVLIFPCHILLGIMCSSPSYRRAAVRNTILAFCAAAITLGILIIRDPEASQRFDYRNDRIGISRIRDTADIWLGNGFTIDHVIAEGRIYFSRLYAKQLTNLQYCTAIALLFLLAWPHRAHPQWPIKRANWLALLTPICLAMYFAVSVSIENVVYQNNDSWILPLFALSLGVAMRASQLIRWLLLTAIFMCVPLTSTATLGVIETNLGAMSFLRSHISANDAIWISKRTNETFNALISDRANHGASSAGRSSHPSVLIHHPQQLIDSQFAEEYSLVQDLRNLALREYLPEHKKLWVIFNSHDRHLARILQLYFIHKGDYIVYCLKESHDGNYCYLITKR